MIDTISLIMLIIFILLANDLNVDNYVFSQIHADHVGNMQYVNMMNLARQIVNAP